ncbi:EGF-like domain-containing protein [Aphelenchoides bicaudatus]|nr:EGF-like domain-containing protein [Aphelenchoides bicaudatus]
MKKLMGFSPNCHNGGHKNLRGNCECPKYFEGDLCEKIICINNGTKTTIKTMIPVQEVCKCPYPRFISGPHCEFIHCQNGGKDAGDGSCRCSDGWYSGQFCEFYASNWLATVGVPLICLIIIFMCCIVCRLDLCPRRSSSRRERRRNHYNNYQMPSRRTYANNPHRFHAHNNPQNITENARMMQENLLNDAACRRTRSRTNESSVNAPTVFRLEHSPIFNPEIMNSPEYKLDLPPPSYEQATRCTPVQSNYHPNTATAILPDYSPPRTNSQSHQTPRQNSQSNENG